MKTIILFTTCFIVNLPVYSQSLGEILDMASRVLIEINMPQEFDITIEKAVFFESADATSATDSYFEIYQGGDLKYRSGIKKDNDNPVFNERISISNFSSEQGLSIVFRDKDMMSDDIIGFVNVESVENGSYQILVKHSDGEYYSYGDVDLLFER